MKTTKEMSEWIASAAPDLVGAVRVAVPFDLAAHGVTGTSGTAAVTDDAVVILSDSGEHAELAFDRVKKFDVRVGVGCVSIEYEGTDGTEHELLRSDMRSKEFYGELVKRLNRRLEGRPLAADDAESFDRACPKCHRPYTPGSHTCYHCAKKSRYLLRVAKMAKPYAAPIALSVLIYFAVAGLNLLPPFLNRILVDDFIQAETKPIFWQFLTVILTIFAVTATVRLLSVFRSVVLIRISSKMIVKLREMVFGKIQRLSVDRIAKRTPGELLNRVTEDTSVIEQFLTRDLGSTVEQITTLVAVVVILFAYDAKLALLILLPVPIVMAANRLFFRYMHKLYSRQWYLNSKANTVLHDIFSGIRVVKAFGMEKREVERYDKAIREEYDISVRNETFFGKFHPILRFLMGVGEFFLLYYVGNKILGGEMTLGEMSQFSAYVSIIYGPLEWLSRLPRMLIRTMVSIVKVYEVIDEESDVADKKNALAPEITGYIDMENVSFGYDTSHNVLKNVSLSIRPGEMIGLVGKSGVGKSTLINLIMRLYDVDEGAIKIDGYDVRDIAQETLRSQIGVVLQETFLFSGTVLENIAYAKPDASYDEIIAASKLAGAHNFIMKLPDAYNTKVGEHGHTLSGGERQRVAIARALLRDPKILILDEATSALDTETEKQIQDALAQLIKNRTTIAIAHRLSTLRNATKIVVLDQGSVAEVGTHNELLAKKGIYFDLVMAQRMMATSTKKQKEGAY